LSTGTLFLSSVIKTNKKEFLNRVKDELFLDKKGSSDSRTERELLSFVRQHVMQYRALPSQSVLNSAGYSYLDTDQPPEYYLQQVIKRAVYNSFKKFIEEMKPAVEQGFDLDKAFELITGFSDNVAKLAISDKFKSLAELGKEIQTQIENRKNGTPEVFIPFGWPSIDKAYRWRYRWRFVLSSCKARCR
jgi:hypothetical protein